MTTIPPELLPPFDSTAMEALSNAIADPGYGIFPELLPLAFQNALSQLMKDKIASNTLVRAGIGHGAEVVSEIRTDSIFWLMPDDTSPTTISWNLAMSTLITHFREALFLPVCSYEGHLAQYPSAGFYKAHLDRRAQSQAREISLITYLNQDWEESDGGQLRIYTDPKKGINGPSIDIFPRAGTIVIFRSETFWHEVLPSTRPRLSLTGWLRSRDT